MTTREKEIEKNAKEYSPIYSPDIESMAKQTGFLDGAHWADKHPKNPWRKIMEELPPIKQKVFFLDTNDIPHIGRLEIGGQIVVSADTPQDDITVTYWMPIPETPKGGEE